MPASAAPTARTPARNTSAPFVAAQPTAAPELVDAGVVVVVVPVEVVMEDEVEVVDTDGLVAVVVLSVPDVEVVVVLDTRIQYGCV